MITNKDQDDPDFIFAKRMAATQRIELHDWLPMWDQSLEEDIKERGKAISRSNELLAEQKTKRRKIKRWLK